LFKILELKGLIDGSFFLIEPYFIIRDKSNFRFRRLYSQKADKAKGVQADQIIELHGYYACKDHPEWLGRIHYHDAERKKRLI